MIPEIRKLLQVIAPHALDRETIDELLRVTADERRWKEAHALFSRIRFKTLRAIERGNRRLELQYAFEEICAKSIYNEVAADDPFDSDSPFWVVPFAISTADALGLDREQVLAAVRC